MTERTLPETWTGLPRGLRDAVLARLVARRLGTLSADAEARPVLERADRGGPVPVSLEQAFFLDRQRRFDGRLAWTIAAPPIVLDKVDVGAVQRAVAALARRHDVLHATIGTADGRPVLVLDPSRPAPLALTTLPLTAALTGAEGWVRKRYDVLLAQPFDPEHGPLWRAELINRGSRGVILLTFCSLIVDGESLHLLDTELRALYAAELAGTAPVDTGRPDADYADYALTQDRLLRAGRYDKPLDWWARRLAGGPPPSWSDGRAPLATANLYEQDFGSATGRALDAYAAAHRTTPHVVLLTEFMRLLAGLDGDDDVWVASATATRDIPGAEAMVGTFARQVLLRLALAEAETDPLQAVQAMLIETMDQEPVPHLLVQRRLEEMVPGAPSPFRYIFNHRRLVDGPEEGDDRDVPFRTGPPAGTAAREEDILLMVLETGARRRLQWYLRADRFDPAGAEALMAGFHATVRRRIGLPGPR